MSARTLLVAIAAVGLLMMGLTAGLVQAHQAAPPSLGDAIEVTHPSGSAPRGTRPPDQVASVPGPTDEPESATPRTRPAKKRDDRPGNGGRAVPPPWGPRYGGDDDDDDDG